MHVIRIIKNEPQSGVLKVMFLYCGKYDTSLHSVAATLLFRFMLSWSHITLVIPKNDEVTDGFSVYVQTIFLFGCYLQ